MALFYGQKVIAIVIGTLYIKVSGSPVKLL